MCGFAGFVGAGLTEDAAETTLRRMGDAISHRGPDSQGIWFDGSADAGLVHRRLSILDLTPAGHQPMTSPSGRFIIAFNGEIYNHAEIREKVQQANFKFEWRGHSDTESLLAAFDAFGIEQTLRLSVGMFAFAAWDRQQRCLILARDRLGEKPLYYAFSGEALIFGSELKSLLRMPGLSPEINRDALALLLRRNCIPAPHSIYRGVAKLPPATWLQISAEAISKGIHIKPKPYWSAYEAAIEGSANRLNFGSDAEAADDLEIMLRKAISGQMVADVPVGAFLSGGVDSSLVVALMQVQSSRPVKSFTIGFNETGYDEAVFAKKVARHLGTDHTELYVTPKEALDVIPQLPEIYCEPFADSSQIPTYLVAKLARQHVKVALSGDGGDELFGGYTRYRLASRLWDKIRLIPLPLRRQAAAAILSVPPPAWDQLYFLFAKLIPRDKRWGTIGEKMHKGAALFESSGGLSLYQHLVTHWSQASVVLGAQEQDSQPEGELPDSALAEQMMLIDTTSYLPDDILVKVDRAAMAVSLETRAPLLDHRLYEYSWRTPLSHKIGDGAGKWLLREVLYRHVPREFVDRPKMGFGVPIDSWLRGPLREWAEELLSEPRLRNEGYFNPAPIRQKWLSHLSGARNWQYHLWDVLMFQAWHEAVRSR